MTGERVAVLRPVVGGEDAMGEPVKAWEAEEVAGCLVKPLSGSSASEGGRPGAVRLAARVALPKAYTADKPPRYFEGARVALTSRGMDAGDADGAFAVVGCPMRTAPCPTRWDTVLELSRVDG